MAPFAAAVLAGEVGGAGVGKGEAVTDCERVLAVLQAAEGEWVADMYGKTRCMVHSRVADLRKDGHVIEQRRFGKKDYRYRLVVPVRVGAGGQLEMVPI